MVPEGISVCTLREVKAAKDAIKYKEDEVLNYFINRSANAHAESLNSKLKGFRTQLRGVQYLPFFMFRTDLWIKGLYCHGLMQLSPVPLLKAIDNRARFKYAYEQGQDDDAELFLRLIAQLYDLEEQYRLKRLTPEEIQLERQGELTFKIIQRMQHRLDKLMADTKGCEVA